MEELVKSSKKNAPEEEITFKNFFVPLTSFKVVFWIIVIGIVVYANMLINGFVWDDTGQIVTNPYTHTLSSISSYFFGSQDINGHLVKIPALFYRPLMATFFTLIYAIVGENAFFY